MLANQPDFPFLVMELVGGPRLSDARPTDLSRVVAIAVQICAALEHAHENSIVHRDLKPDNVLLSGTSDSSNVKLADLGLALPAYGARISRAGVDCRHGSIHGARTSIGPNC